MPIFIRPRWGKFRKNSESNYFLANRLIFRAQPDWEDFGELEKLPTSYVTGMSPIENRVKALREEALAKSRKKIGKVVKGVFPEEAKICRDKFNKLKSPVENNEQFNDAISDVTEFSEILSKLRSVDLDQVDIEFLLSSDVSAFFDQNLRNKLEKGQVKMLTADKIFNETVWNLNDPVFMMEARTGWKTEERRLKGEIKNVKKDIRVQKLEVKRLKKRKAGPEEINKAEQTLAELEQKLYLLQQDLDNKINWINRRGAQLQAEKEEWLERTRTLSYIETDRAKKGNDEAKLELMRRQAEDEKSRQGRIHKLTEQIENQNIATVADKLSYEDKLQITNILLEAREIRLERVREHFKSKYDELVKLFEAKKKEKIFGKSTIQAMEQDFVEFKKLLIDQKQNDPNILKNLARNLNTAEIQLNMSAEEIAEIKKNRPQIEKEVLDGFADMESLVSQFRPEELNRFKDELLKDEQKRLKAIEEKSTITAKTKYDERAGVSSIYKKAIGVIDELGDEGSPLRKHLAEFKERLQKIGEMEPEELQAVKQDLALLKPKLELFKNLDKNIEKALGLENDDVRNAHQAIIDLESATDIEEIEDIIDRTIGSEHFKAVSSSEFESKYRKYTHEGFMVFYQKEDELQNIVEWSIVVDKSALKNPENLKELKRQLTHELLHLEFEKSDDIKNQVRKTFVSSPEWPKIRQAFIDKVESEGKKPPTGDEWTDDDILSELYAMQNEIGNVWAPGDSADSRLNNLLVGAGLASGFKDAAEKIKGYEKGIEKIRGMEGMDTGGDLGAIEGGEAGIVGSYEEFQNNIEMQGNRIKGLKKSEFLGFVPGASGALGTLEKMHKNTNGLNEYFKDHRDNTILAAGVGDSISHLKSGIDEVEKALGKASEKTPNLEINPLRKLWNNSAFLSINDMVQVLVDVKEYVSRRHNRKKSDHAARLGMALFQGTNLGREAMARQQKAEQEEVQEWQSRYEDLDAWRLMDEIKSMASSINPSSDQLKAILRLLAQKGRIDWRYPPLWLVLNKLQNSVHLTPDDPVLLHNPPLMRQKLHAALGEIWDYDEFLTLERQNESSYDGELRKYLPSYDRMQDQLTERLDQLLQLHREGKRVDPMEYESIMVYAIEKGKSFAEQVMFHLMAGMAYGLLASDRGLALDKYLNEWPATQWIYSKSPPLSREDYVYICEKYFPDDYKAGTITQGNHGKEFKNFYWVHVQNDAMTVQRVRKSVSERKWDHDWTRSIACLGDANTAKRFFAGKSGQQEAKDTGVENAYAGAVQWLEENARDPTKIDYRSHFTRMAGWLGMSEGIMDRVAYYRGDNDISTRANENMENAVAREQGITNHKTWTMRQNRQKIQGFLDDLDPDLFRLLRSKKDVRGEEEKKELGLYVKEILMQKYPSKTEEWESIQHIDEVYEKMDLIVKTMFDSLSDVELKAKIERLQVFD